MPRIARRELLVAAVLIVTCMGAGAVSGLLGGAGGESDWYQSLRKPSFQPPGWLFGPVWSLLYLMMAVAAWLVWLPGHMGPRRSALACFAAQLALNLAWSPLFFRLEQPFWALLDLFALWVLLLVTIRLFFLCRMAAGWLLVPYLAWVTFAGLLNLRIWQLNP